MCKITYSSLWIIKKYISFWFLSCCFCVVRAPSAGSKIECMFQSSPVLCTCAGEGLGCTPLLEILDLSWNSGVGGGALQNLLGRLQPPLRELHLVACQLTEADSSALGADFSLITTAPPLLWWILFRLFDVLLSGGMVATLPRLCVLDVSCNPQLVKDSNGAAFNQFAASLSQATPLTTLRLQACGLTADSLAALGERLFFSKDAVSMTTSLLS